MTLLTGISSITGLRKLAVGSSFGALAASKTYTGAGGDSYSGTDLSSVNAATVLFDITLAAPASGVFMAIEYGSDSSGGGGGGFFMLTDSEFGLSNVLEFDSNCSSVAGTHDLATCPRPSYGVPHKMAWIIDRTKFPSHSVFVDGVKQTITPYPGYTNNQASNNFAGPLYVNVGARQGGAYPANITVSSPPIVVPRALSDAEAMGWTS